MSERKETVEEYLARGGKITQLEYCICEKKLRKKRTEINKRLKHNADFLSVGTESGKDS